MLTGGGDRVRPAHSRTVWASVCVGGWAPWQARLLQAQAALQAGQCSEHRSLSTQLARALQRAEDFLPDAQQS